KGNCTDFHTLFIALARASGIPARWNMGFPLAYGDGGADGAQEVKGLPLLGGVLRPRRRLGAGRHLGGAQAPRAEGVFLRRALGEPRAVHTRARRAARARRQGPAPQLLHLPVARADGQDVPSEWTLRYTDEPSAARAVAGSTPEG